ncbi:hypothetical protein [Nocardiopsis potens]|uniref:hypothetical protein n=1 Tax=Nocardiopsis potens TaxID=1246458 RepID=UPI00034B1B09|nr:hypothetical protein [Nocardiopsis potens]
MSLLPVRSPVPEHPYHRLDGRIMLQVKNAEDAPLADVSPLDSGIVFCGGKAAEDLRALTSGHGFSGPVLIDPAAYERHAATPERPFIVGQASLFNDDELEEELDRLLEQKSLMALTPTGYLRAGDTRSLSAAVHRVTGLNRSDVLLTVPIDSGWLTGNAFPELVSLLRRTPVPKAVVLGASWDPLDRVGAAERLRELFASVPGCGLLRTDLAAIDAMVHGADFAAIGDSPSARHTRPPRPEGGGPRARSSPAVLIPRMLTYRRGEEFATVLAEADPPRCPCGFCASWMRRRGLRDDGRPLTSFTTELEKADAHAHNLAVWSALWSWVQDVDSRAQGLSRWKRLCDRAVQEHRSLNEVARSPGGGFEVPQALKAWAGPV